MATKFKMAAIYQNVACRYGRLVLVRVNISYLLDMDSKMMLNILQQCNKRITLFKKNIGQFHLSKWRPKCLEIS